MFQATCLLTFLLSAIFPAAMPNLYEPSGSHEEQADTLRASKVSDHRSGRERLHTGVPVIEIGTSLIERSGARELHEILRILPGLNVKDYGGIGGMKTVSVRGLGSTHTAVCMDGMMLSDVQHGSIDLSGFDLDDTGNILVDIGSAEGIFKPAQAFASGSLISLAGKSPDLEGKTSRLSARMTYGSFDTYKPSLRYDRKISDGWVLSARGSYLSSQGNYPFEYAALSGGSTRLRREGSDVSAMKSMVRLEGNMRNGGTLRAAASWTDSERGIPGPVILYVQDPTERIWNKDLSSTISYESAQDGSAWHYRVGGSFRKTRDRYTNTDAVYPTPVDDRYLQQAFTASGILERVVPIGGFGQEIRFVLAQDITVTGLEANTIVCPDPFRFGSYTSAAARYSGNRLRATASLTAVYLHETSSGSESAKQTAPDRSRLSPSLSVSYLVAERMYFRAFVKDGFRVPTFNDLYYDRVGSISLVPEKAFQSGAGLTWKGNVGDAVLDLTADAYHNRVRDKIVAIPTMFVWRMRNLGRVSMTGADLSVGMSIPVGEYSLRSDASCSFLRAVDLSDPSAKNYGHQIQYTPRSSGSLSSSLFKDGFSLNYTLIAVGRRYFLPQNLPENALEAYFDHSVAVRKSFSLRSCTLDIAAEALNLAGRNYEIVHSYPMPGRQFRLTMTLMI